MDPLSEVLSLLRLKSYVSGDFAIGLKTGIQVARHQGIKCYAPISGSCWLSVEGHLDVVQIKAGDCVILPRGLPFCLAGERSLSRVNFRSFGMPEPSDKVLSDGTQACSLIGGHFLLAGGHSEILLKSLPAIVHIRKESDKATIRWSLERLIEELRDPQPGGSLMAQQLAYMMLVQALRLHLQEEASKGVGWLFALADSQMRIAITCMHDHPQHPWTLHELADRAGMSRTVFAQQFKRTVGTTSMEYLTRWRMLFAGDRLKSSNDSVSAISSAVGYKTESAFGKAFRRVWGCSPREHRQRSDATASRSFSSQSFKGQSKQPLHPGLSGGRRRNAPQ